MKRRRSPHCRSVSLYCRHCSSTDSGTASGSGGGGGMASSGPAGDPASLRGRPRRWPPGPTCGQGRGSLRAAGERRPSPALALPAPAPAPAPAGTGAGAVGARASPPPRAGLSPRSRGAARPAPRHVAQDVTSAREAARKRRRRPADTAPPSGGGGSSAAGPSRSRGLR